MSGRYALYMHYHQRVLVCRTRYGAEVALRSLDTTNDLFNVSGVLGYRWDKHASKYNILICVSNNVPDWLIRDVHGVSEVRDRLENEDFWDFDALEVEVH